MKVLAGAIILSLAVTGTIGWAPLQTDATTSTAAPAETQEVEVTRYEDGYRFDQHGWIYVHIEGEPYERGYQHGYLLAPELAELVEYNEFLNLWSTGREWQFFIDEAVKQFVPKIDEEYLDEIKGIAEGAQAAGTDISWEQVLAINGANDLTTWLPFAQEDNDSGEGGHCSSFVATGDATAGGKVVIAHNAWTSYVDGVFQNLILDIEPAQGHRIVMQSMPGLIDSGSDFFVTEAGLLGSETTIACFNAYDANGAPEFYRVRKAMQYADNPDEFVETMLKDNNGGYADSWLLGDLNTGEIMRFELGLKYHSVVRKDDGYFIGFNGVYDSRIRNLECGYGDSFSDIRTQVGARRVRLTQLMEEHYGTIDVETAKDVLADSYDVYLDLPNHPSAHTVEGHYELDPRSNFSYPGWWPLPYQPEGAIDGKVTDSDMAKDLSLWARFGSPSGMPFDADEFLAEHLQWSQYEGYLKSRPSQPWAKFVAGTAEVADTSESVVQNTRNALYGEWIAEEEAVQAILDFDKDGSLKLGASGVTQEMRWNLPDETTLVLVAGSGLEITAELEVSDGELSLTMDDVTVVYTRVEE